MRRNEEPQKTNLSEKFQEVKVKWKSIGRRHNDKTEYS